jgi:hypothetical protein
MLLLLCLTINRVTAQSVDSLSGKVLNFPARLLGRIGTRTERLNREFSKQSEKMLREMSRQESRLQKKLARVDPAAAQSLFSGSAEKYAALVRQIGSDSSLRGRSLGGVYAPYLDSLQGSVAFLHQHPQLLSGPSANQLQALKGVNTRLQALQAKMIDADQAKAYVQQRKQQIAQYIARHTNYQQMLGPAYQGLNKQAYYYSQQLREYKEIWNDPDKMTRHALALLDRLPAFQTFMKDHSMLAGLFHIPAGYGTPQGLEGLQTRDQVAQQIQGQVSAGGPAGAAALQSNLQSAESQLDGYKNKLGALGAGNGDLDMPNFKPNDQKTKTIWRRLEYGANFQTTRNNYLFPTVTDFGLSLGYRLGHDNVAGVGASYKLGWGNGIRHIAFSSQGVGLRSFLQIKIKGSFSATGGFEYNYTTPFSSYQQLKQLQYWTKSGLLGVTKTVSVKSRVFRKTTLSLLWDFLSYQAVPKTQPVLFRVGYVWK